MSYLIFFLLLQFVFVLYGARREAKQKILPIFSQDGKVKPFIFPKVQGLII